MRMNYWDMLWVTILVIACFACHILAAHAERSVGGMDFRNLSGSSPIKIPKKKIKIIPTDNIYLLLNREQAVKYGQIVWKSPEGMNALRYKIKILEEKYADVHKNDVYVPIPQIKHIAKMKKLYNLALSTAEYYEDKGSSPVEIDFKVTTDGVVWTKENYIKYVRYSKQAGFYKYFSKDDMDKLKKRGKKYGLMPDDIASSPVGNVFYGGSYPVK